MNDDYRKLTEQIRVPDCLNEQVIATVRQRGAAERAPGKKWQSLLRAAACAALALMLAVGGFRLRPTENEDIEAGDTELTYELGLTAYAAGVGANGAVLLQTEGKTPEELDRTTRTVAITYADGREESGTYYLRKETLRIVFNEDGSEILVPALAGETAEVVSGLYAVPAEESRWFCWPVDGSNTVSLSAPYGLRKETAYFHAGIDIPAPQGTAVTAAAAGTVTEGGYDTARGNYLLVNHEEGLTTLYAHCSELLVDKGDRVESGMQIAAVGATGMATGPHLHFEVRQDGEAQNPVAYFDREVRDTLNMG